MRVYALVELGDEEAIDVYLRRETRSPRWRTASKTNQTGRGLLYVEPIELDERAMSPN